MAPPSHRLFTDASAPLVHVLGLTLSPWMFCAHVGFALGIAVAVWRAPRFGIGRGRLLAITTLSYPLALVVARLFSVIFDGNWDRYVAEPQLLWQLGRGGFVYYGGALGGAVGLALGCRLLHVGFRSCADVCAPGAALGIAIGRIGCFLNGCCYGTPTTLPIGIEYRNFALPVRPIGVPLHPAPLYETAGLLFIAGILLWRQSRGTTRRPGADALVLVGGYALLRFLVEFVRADRRGNLLGLPTSQALSVMVVAVIAGFALRRWITDRDCRTPRPG